jgi:DNA polymerase I-like protein with 3'-5' exonuclease and polymerase domains
LDAEGFEIILTVHDEIVLECPIDDVEKTMRRLEEIMCTPPAWAHGLPLGVECASMARYGK